MNYYSRSKRYKKYLVILLTGSNLVLFLTYLFALGLAYQQDLTWRADFSAFYTASAMIRDGQGARLYDIDLQGAYQGKLLSPHIAPGKLVLAFINPPFMGLALAPLALLPLKAAYAAWALLQVGFLGVLVWQLKKVTRAWTSTEQWLAITATLALPMILMALMLGAISVLILIGLIQAYRWLKAGQPLAAGLCLTLCLLKPQLVIFPLIFLLGQRNWKVIAGLIAGSLFLFVASGLVFGWKIWPDYLQALFAYGNSEQYGVIPASMYNLRGLLSALLGEVNAVAIARISQLAFLLALLGTFLLSLKISKSGPAVFDWGFGLAIVLGLFFNYHLNPQDGLQLLFPAILFFNRVRLKPSQRSSYSIFVLACPYIFLVSELALKDKLLIRLPVIAMLVLIGWMLRFRPEIKAKNQSIEPEAEKASAVR